MIPFRSNPIMPAIVVDQIFASAPIPPLLLIFLFDSSPFFFGWVGQRDFFFQTKKKIRKCNFRSVVKLSELRVECRANECLKDEKEEELKSKCTSQGGEGFAQHRKSWSGNFKSVCVLRV
jgi:hypothetical protein